MIDKDKRFVGKWWLWILFLLVISAPVGWAVKALGLVGKTVTERIVFEQSYQKKSSDASKLRMFKAQKKIIEKRLENRNLSLDQRVEIESMLSAIEIQIAATEGN